MTRARRTRLRRLVAPLRWDVALGAIVLFIVSASFMMAGAAVLYPRLASGELSRLFEGGVCLPIKAQIWHSIHPGAGVGVLRVRAGGVMGHASIVPGDLRPRDARISHGHLARSDDFLSPRCSNCDLRLRVR